MNERHPENSAELQYVQSAAPHAPVSAHKVSRRAALRTWITRAAPLVLLAACARPASGAAAVGESAARPANSAAKSSAQTEPARTVPATTTPAGAVQQSLPSCVITPQQTEGPYFVDERLNRSDIRSDPTDGSVREGIPLRLTMQVTQVDGSACTPLAGTYVDIWQCDAQGVYSDVDDRSTGSRAGTSKFLRGYQVTDENGLVEFTTIFPGWYRGRAVHIHFKVRTALDGGRGRETVSQLYFDDALIDQVHALPPYAAKGQRDTPNSRDGVFRNGGDRLLVPVVQEGEGYAGTFNLGVQLS